MLSSQAIPHHGNLSLQVQQENLYTLISLSKEGLDLKKKKKGSPRIISSWLIQNSLFRGLNYRKMSLYLLYKCALLSPFSHVQLFVTLWTVAHLAPLSMGFSRQEYWCGCHVLLQGISLTQGSNPSLQWLLYCGQISFTAELPEKPPSSVNK